MTRILTEISLTSAIQNITVDKDMIIEEVYVSKGDEVKKDDKLISFDMTSGSDGTEYCKTETTAAGTGT